MEEDNQINFHPTDEGNKDIVKHINKHYKRHYRKYLFSLGVFGGIMISFMMRTLFDTNIISNQLNAEYQASPEIAVLTVFDEIQAVAHEKDNFFHQEGKIYTLSGETLFHKYDTMFHILDNGYHQARSNEEKIERAKKFIRFIDLQNELFAATEYPYPEKDRKLMDLEEDFNKALADISAKKEKGTASGENIYQ